MIFGISLCLSEAQFSSSDDLVMKSSLNPVEMAHLQKAHEGRRASEGVFGDLFMGMEGGGRIQVFFYDLDAK